MSISLVVTCPTCTNDQHRHVWMHYNRKAKSHRKGIFALGAMTQLVREQPATVAHTVKKGGKKKQRKPITMVEVSTRTDHALFVYKKKNLEETRISPLGELWRWSVAVQARRRGRSSWEQRVSELGPGQGASKLGVGQGAGGRAGRRAGCRPASELGAGQGASELGTGQGAGKRASWARGHGGRRGWGTVRRREKSGGRLFEREERGVAVRAAGEGEKKNEI
ncbi:hypothetical protein ACOSQ2_020896 [Xanthoceras sorbifolium]